MMKVVLLFVVLFGIASSLGLHNETKLNFDDQAPLASPRIVGYVNSYGVKTSSSTAYNVLILAFLYVDGNADVSLGGAIQGWQTKTTVSTVGLGEYSASGKQVFLSIGGADWSTSTWQSIVGKEATLALNIRNLANQLTSADSSGKLQNVKVTGVDIDYEDNNGIYPPNKVYNGVDLLVTLSRELKKQGFLVSHAPQGPYLCTPSEDTNPAFSECSPGIGGYLEVMKQGGQYIDFLNIQYYNNPSFNDVSQLFDNYRGLVALNISPSKPVVGKPNQQNDAGSGYIPVDQLLSSVLCPLKRQYSDFGGAMTWKYHDDSWAQTVLNGFNSCN